MILKIERYKDNQKWWIYDNIVKISISNKMYHSKHSVDITCPSISAVFLDVEAKCECEPDTVVCNDCIGYYTLICRLNNDEEYSIIFDTVAYLLNDNGKTIEKIVANYKD